jgi:hypothetical protein
MGTFKVGDVVALRSDRTRPMVIHELQETPRQCVWCTWMKPDGEIAYYGFNPDVLAHTSYKDEPRA